MDALYLGNNRVLNRLFTNQFMLTSSSDLTVMPCIAFDGYWESGTTRAFLSLLKNDSVVFDLGANFGYYSIISLSKVKNGAVYAFEPQPKVYDILKDSLYINKSNSVVKAEKAAISDKDGFIDFYPHDKYTANASIYSGKKQGDYASNPIKVETISLDSYIKNNNIEKVDVVKIDTEGNEPLVYSGMKDTIANNNIKLVLEFCSKMYIDPEGFYNKLSNDFEYIYKIQVKSELRLGDFNDFCEKVPTGYCMLLLSKEPL